MAIKQFCRYRGCNNTIEFGEKYCSTHKLEQHERYDRYRGSAASRGYDHKWRKARAQHLEQHPLCVDCLEEGIIKPATDVDHIIPHKGDMKLFWDRNNWASRCKRHHSIKTAREDGGFGNKV